MTAYDWLSSDPPVVVVPSVGTLQSGAGTTSGTSDRVRINRATSENRETSPVTRSTQRARNAFSKLATNQHRMQSGSSRN